MEFNLRELSTIFTTLCYIRKHEALTESEEEVYQRFINEGWEDLS